MPARRAQPPTIAARPLARWRASRARATLAPMDTRLPEIARSTVAARGMLPDGAVVLAMVSGGADSVALLRLLASGELGPARALSVLHVDHMLRGADSEGDAAFVADVCATLGVPCDVTRYDVAAYAAEAGLNLEDAGRRVRYRFAEEELDARCDEAGADRRDGRIVTAHTYDDRMETFLMRLAAGAGPAGLMGMPYARGRLVRPLLDARRSDVVAYLRGLSQDWCEDATNADTARARARVRAELLPLLERMNPRFGEALSRTLAVLGDEDAWVDAAAKDAAASALDVRAGEVRADRAALAALPRALGRRALRVALAGAFPDDSRIEFDHIEAVLDGLASTGFARDLPGGLRAFSEYATLVISRAPIGDGPLAPALLSVPGTADLGGAGMLSAQDADPRALVDDALVALIDADRFRGPLTVDSFRAGDRIRPLGMCGTRKVSDVLTDAKVPRRERLSVPVVRDGESIVWLAGVRMSDDYRVGPGTARAVRLAWTGPVGMKQEGPA
jgi:tRNA(Ile)-lysidine synthase